MKGKKCELENLPSILQDEKYSGEAKLKEDLTEMKVLLIKANFFKEWPKRKDQVLMILKT